MKQQLMDLKKEVIEYLKKKKIFEQHQVEFNQKVERKKKKINLEEVIQTKDAYTSAMLFEINYPEILNIAHNLMKQYPKIEIEMLRNIMIDLTMEKFELKEDDLETAIQLVDNFYLYEFCGYFKLEEEAENLFHLRTKTYHTIQDILNESNQSIRNHKKLINQKVKNRENSKISKVLQNNRQ